MFGDLNLQKPKSHKVIGLGTSRLLLAPVRVDLINMAQLGHGLVKLGKTDPDPSGDKVDRTLAVLATIVDQIHQSSPESDSKGDREVYMVGQGEEPLRRPSKRSSGRSFGQGRCHTPFRERGNEASIRVPRMFKSHAWQQYD
jgi:hypothetical protein